MVILKRNSFLSIVYYLSLRKSTMVSSAEPIHLSNANAIRYNLNYLRTIDLLLKGHILLILKASFVPLYKQTHCFTWRCYEGIIIASTLLSVPTLPINYQPIYITVSWEGLQPVLLQSSSETCGWLTTSRIRLVILNKLPLLSAIWTLTTRSYAQLHPIHLLYRYLFRSTLYLSIPILLPPIIRHLNFIIRPIQLNTPTLVIPYVTIISIRKIK